MTQPHKHAAIIKAWADGAEIEFQSNNGPWSDVSEPRWYHDHEYRVKPQPQPQPQPHKWQKEMDAFKEGKTIQGRCGPDYSWVTAYYPFCETPPLEYRIKPETVRVRLFWWKPHSEAVINAVSETEQYLKPREEWTGFIGWATDWMDVEQP